MIRRRFTILRSGDIPNSEIWYTSTEGKIVEPYNTDVFGATIVSNTYENGKGVIKFDQIVTSIGEDAFYNCDSLSSVTIPNNVTSIGKYAFENCANLKEVICMPINPPTGNIRMFKGIHHNAKIYVPAGSVAAYKAASYWNNYANEIVEI